MTTNATSAIEKIDYTLTPHPSGVIALSLQNTPALIESLLPVQKLSVDVYKERMAVSGQTLTALGSYWKGRKPLVLNRACVLASLLPATGNDIKDLEVFELLMGMDDVSMSKRLGLPKPATLLAAATAVSAENSAYFEVTEGAEGAAPKVKWRSDVSDAAKHEVAAATVAQSTYKTLAAKAKRAEEVTDTVSSHIWPAVNQHLGTNAFSMPELVEQLGVMRFGHRPTVGDTFSGSGQIPFAAAQLGCDVYASDLNPISCMLTWGAFNIVGASKEKRVEIEKDQKELVAKVKAEIDALGFESDGNGWRGKVYLYCLEVTCPSSGWKVPVLPTLVVSKGKSVYAQLVPVPQEKRYDIVLVNDASVQEMDAAEKGTYRSGSVVHSVDGVEHISSIASIRGDYKDTVDGKRVSKNKLRQWEKSDVVFRDDDIYNERLYAIQWIQDLPEDAKGRAKSEFRTVTDEDLARESLVTQYVQENLDDWQQKGWVPDTRIEPGDKTDEPIRTRGWTHWHQLFNPRQLLILSSFNSKKHPATAISSAIMANNCSKLCMWNKSTDQVMSVFTNQSLNTLVVYGAFGFIRLEKFMNLARCSSVELPEKNSTRIKALSSSEINYSADLFITDPPYGDAVKYEEIYEFFIAWMRKNPPAEFADWTWDSRRELAVKGEDHDFRLGMIAAYKRMAECMPDNGTQVLMFTHQGGDVWADMANIVWASGLRVTAAWYLVTETDSALRNGSYVKGTILLVLRKRLGADRTNQTDLAYELEEEVAAQVKRLTGMNDEVKADAKRAKDGNLFEDADLQMAGYAAALKVLTKYSIIDGKDMAKEALRPRIAGQATLVEGLIEFATATANKMLVPVGMDNTHWEQMNHAERFYLKMLEQESHGLNQLGNYQNFAKAFAVSNFSALMANSSANKASLKSAKQFGNNELSATSELFQTPSRAVLYALKDLQEGKDIDLVIKGVDQNLKQGAFFGSRDRLAAISRFIADKLVVMRPEEASKARVLADGLKNMST